MVETAVLAPEVFMTSTTGSSSLRSLHETKTLPLWRRTQLRLQNMESFSMRHRNSSDGFDERIQLQDTRIQLACLHLVLLIKEWEERQSERLTL